MTDFLVLFGLAAFCTLWGVNSELARRERHRREQESLARAWRRR